MRTDTLMLVGVSAMASCALPAVELVDRSATGSGGAQATSASTTTGQGGDDPTCTHTRWPDPPAMNSGAGSDVTFVTAVRMIDIGESKPDITTSGPSIGYDLDQVCTSLDGGSSCLLPTSANPSRSIDGPGGVDNAAAVLFAIIKQFEPLLDSARFSEGAENGDWSLLVRVQGYNGLPDDPEVTVSLYPSPGLRAESCVSIDAKPKWDGADRWPVGVRGLQLGKGLGSDGGEGTCGPGIKGYSLDKPRFIDTHAYVSGGVVVANLPDIEVTAWLAKSPLSLELKAGFLTGRIVESDSGYKLVDGVFTGRWPTSAVLRQLAASIDVPPPVCTDNSVYQLLKDGVCESRDIASTLGGPTTPCDALSLAIAFEAHPAKFGAVVPIESLESGCPDELAPELDDCDK